MRANIDRRAATAESRPSPVARLAAVLASWSLDRELASGVDPGTRPALAIRARSLIGRRRRIADRVDAVVDHAADGALTRPSRGLQVALRSTAIADAEVDLHRLSAELREHEDCRAQGVALAHLLLVDGVSPLYEAGAEGGPLFRRQAPRSAGPNDLLAAARSAYRALTLATPL